MSKQLKVGELAFVRTTEEPISILAIRKVEHENYPELSGFIAVVRRPVASETSGIQHQIEEFYLEEIETNDAKSERLLRDMEEMKARFNGSKKIDSSSLPGLN